VKEITIAKKLRNNEGIHSKHALLTKRCNARDRVSAQETKINRDKDVQ